MFRFLCGLGGIATFILFLQKPKDCILLGEAQPYFLQRFSEVLDNTSILSIFEC